MLRILRFFENLFFNLGIWFEDWADSIDEDFLNEIREAIDEPPARLLK